MSMMHPLGHLQPLLNRLPDFLLQRLPSRPLLLPHPLLLLERNRMFPVTRASATAQSSSPGGLILLETCVYRCGCLLGHLVLLARVGQV